MKADELSCLDRAWLDPGSALLQLILGWDEGVRQGPCFFPPLSLAFLFTDKTPWLALDCTGGQLVMRRALPSLMTLTERTRRDETRPERAGFLVTLGFHRRK